MVNNFIHHNGEMGIGGGGMTGALIGGNEISFNVWNGVSCGWECGGAKFAVSTGLHVVGNYVHDNAGEGLWTDIDCSDVVYEKNRIENNLGAGISHEISGKAVICNNSFLANGAKTFGWGWQGQVQIQNSSGAEVYGNVLVLDSKRGGNGLIVIQQDRGARHLPRNNWIRDNDVSLPAGDGALAGWFADYRTDRFSAANRWDSNRYHLHSAGSGQDVWVANAWMQFADWQATGQDRHSTADTAGDSR